MKNLLFFLGFAILAAGCEKGRNSDYLTPRDFVVVNQTDSQITYTDTTLDITVGVAAGETKQIFDREFVCQKGEGYADLVPFGRSFFVSPQDHILSVDNKKLPETIWLRDYWEFSPQGDRFPTYTLTVTDELIASTPTNETTQTRAAAPYQANPNNPYSLSVVQRSLNVLEGANAPTLSATHHYIRILPRDTIEVRILTDDLNLDLLPYPFDYELTDVEIVNYENTLINGFAWQYCLVEPDFQMPSGINYELLDYAYLQNDDPGTRAPDEQLDHDIYSAVIDKAFELTGNSTSQTRVSAWQPSATIKYNSGVSGEATMPLENVRVRVNTFFNTGQSYTDASGNVTIKKGWGGKFRKATKYIIIWSKDGQWKIHDKAGKAKHKGPTQKSHWNFTISGDGTNHDAVCATIHRALNIYYNKTYPQLAGLAKYSNIDVKEHHNEYSTPQLGYVNGSFDSSVLTNEIHIWGKTYKPRTPVQMLATTFHELGHASHYIYLGGMFYKNAGMALQESWANGIRYAYMSALYPDSYSSIVDDFAYTDEYTAVIESLIWQGASLQQLQSCLFGCNSFADFRTHIKAVTQVPDGVVDYIFANPTTPIRINLDAPISGPSELTAGTMATYSVSSTLPTGVTFIGWTISPSSYTTSGGTTGTTLNINFGSAARYTLSANFNLLGNSTHTIAKVVDVRTANWVPPTPIITADRGEVGPNDVATFTIQNSQSGASYQWEYVGDVASGGTNNNKLFLKMPPLDNTVVLPLALTARARMTLGGQTSAWSATVSVLNLYKRRGIMPDSLAVK